MHRYSALVQSSTMQLFILLLILLTPVGSKSEDTCHQEYCKPGQCYQILEDALLSYPENLYKLQQAFFSAEMAIADRLAFSVCIHLTEETRPFVNFSADLEWCQGESCSSDGQVGCWRVSWSSSLLYGAISRQLFGLDNTLTVLLYFAINRDHNSLVRHYHSSIELYVSGSLPCSRIEASSLDEAVITLATWFKAYASVRSKPDSLNKEDVGYITRLYGFYDVEGTDSHHNSLHIIHVILLVAFIILNITAQLFVVILVPRNYCRVIEVLSERGEDAVNSYWSLAIVAAVMNLAFYIASFLFWAMFKFTTAPIPSGCPIKALCNNPTIYLDANIPYSIRILLILLAFFLDLLLAIRIRKYQLPYCYGQCCCSSAVWSKAAKILAVWNILVFLQFHIMSVIPFCILIMVSPMRAISAIAGYGTLLLLFIITVAHVLKMCRHTYCQNTDRTNSGILCIACEFIIHLCAILALLILILTVIVSYVLFLKVGAGKGKVPEVVWSLVPPVLLSLLGWYVKKRFLQEKSSSGMSHSEYQYTPLQEDETEESV